MRFQYTGPGPVPGDDEIIRPGDIREFDQEPDWGPWECIGPDPEPEAAGLLRWNGEVTPPPDLPAPPAAAPVTPKGF